MTKTAVLLFLVLIAAALPCNRKATKFCRRRGRRCNSMESLQRINCGALLNRPSPTPPPQPGANTCSSLAEMSCRQQVGTSCVEQVGNQVFCAEKDTTKDIILLDFKVETDAQTRLVFNKAKNFLQSFLIGVQGFPSYQVTIGVDVSYIDGAGKILGSAGPNRITLSPQVSGRKFWLAQTGSMKFDSADIAKLRREETLQNVIIHEMMHVLGHGTLWENNGCQDAGCTDQVDKETSTVGVEYKCSAAQAEFKKAGGRGILPIENTMARGSRCAHWRESVLKAELGTPALNQGATTSRITVAAFQDNGFRVDFDSPLIDQDYKVPGLARSTTPSKTIVNFEPDEPKKEKVELPEDWWKDRAEGVPLSPLNHEELVVVRLRRGSAGFCEDCEDDADFWADDDDDVSLSGAQSASASLLVSAITIGLLLAVAL